MITEGDVKIAPYKMKEKHHVHFVPINLYANLTNRLKQMITDYLCLSQKKT